MTSVNNSPREICLRETDDNFFVAVNRPYQEYEADYARLAHLGRDVSVHSLDEGSQVFVYPRESLYPLTIKVMKKDSGGHMEDVAVTDKELLMHRVETAALHMAGVVVYPAIEKVADKIPPNQSDLVSS